MGESDAEEPTLSWTRHTIIPVGSGVGSDSGGGTLQRTVGEIDAEDEHAQPQADASQTQAGAAQPQAAQRPPWRARLESLAFTNRLGVKADPAVGPEGELDVPDRVISDVCRATIAFVKPTKKKCPEWLLRLKEGDAKVKEAAHAAAAAEAAVLAAAEASAADAKRAADAADAAAKEAAAKEAAGKEAAAAAAETPADAAETAAAAPARGDGSEPATGGGATEPATGSGSETTPEFVKGDIVMGTAWKEKSKWDGWKCEITEVLTNHYKVKMLEGPETGTCRKYVKKMVVPFGPSHFKATAASADVPAPKLSKSIMSMEDLANLWPDDDDK